MDKYNLVFLAINFTIFCIVLGLGRVRKLEAELLLRGIERTRRRLDLELRLAHRQHREALERRKKFLKVC